MLKPSVLWETSCNAMTLTRKSQYLDLEPNFLGWRCEPPIALL